MVRVNTIFASASVLAVALAQETIYYPNGYKNIETIGQPATYTYGGNLTRPVTVVLVEVNTSVLW